MASIWPIYPQSGSCSSGTLKRDVVAFLDVNYWPEWVALELHIIWFAEWQRGLSPFLLEWIRFAQQLPPTSPLLSRGCWFYGKHISDFVILVFLDVMEF
jgi:hypothetical protein